jgi:hypothetical protein
MEEIRIDLTRYLAQDRPVPMDDHHGMWTFIIDGHPVAIFGTYGEAETLAKLYVRMYDAEPDDVMLSHFETAGRTREWMN